MRRDFSEAEKQRLLALVADYGQGTGGAFDWLGDAWYGLGHWLGILNVKKYKDNLEEYHRKMIDKNDETAGHIEEIFAAVAAVDSEYGNCFSSVKETAQALKVFMTSLGASIGGPEAGSNSWNPGATLSPLWDKYSNAKLDLAWKTMETILHHQSKISKEEKDAYIQAFENAHPETAKDLDELLDKLSDDEIREIKFTAYLVSEPYRTIYLNDLNSYTIGNISGSDTGYFWSVDNTINVDMPGEPKNPRGPYTTFFHESGHALDYNYQNDGSFYSETYRNADGQSLMDVLYADVRADVSNTINGLTTDPTTQQHLLDYIMGAKSVPLSELSSTEQALLKKIQKHYKSDMAGALNEAPSDVYGGVTSNIIVGDYGHWNDSYWYDSSGNPTNRQCRELWAEYYSYCMTGNTVAMENLKNHFPNASAFLDEMAASMAGGS